MTNKDIYIMFNDFLNGIELEYKGNREAFINCSIRKYNNRSSPLYLNLEEKRKGAPILRSIKEAGKYNQYLSFFGKDNMKWLNL